MALSKGIAGSLAARFGLGVSSGPAAPSQAGAGRGAVAAAIAALELPAEASFVTPSWPATPAGLAPLSMPPHRAAAAAPAQAAPAAAGQLLLPATAAVAAVAAAAAGGSQDNIEENARTRLVVFSRGSKDATLVRRCMHAAAPSLIASAKWHPPHVLLWVLACSTVHTMQGLAHARPHICACGGASTAVTRHHRMHGGMPAHRCMVPAATHACTPCSSRLNPGLRCPCVCSGCCQAARWRCCRGRTCSSQRPARRCGCMTHTAPASSAALDRATAQAWRWVRSAQLRAAQLAARGRRRVDGWRTRSGGRPWCAR